MAAAPFRFDEDVLPESESFESEQKLVIDPLIINN
jgi:hypothetical protein